MTDIILYVFFTLSSIILSIRDVIYLRVRRLHLILFFCITGVLRLISLFAVGSSLSQVFLPLAYGAAAFALFFTVRFITKNKLGFADVLFASGCALVIDFTSWLYAMLLACAGVLCFAAGKTIVLRLSRQPLLPSAADTARMTGTPPAADTARMTGTPPVDAHPVFLSKIPFIPFLAAGTLVVYTASFFL